MRLQPACTAAEREALKAAAASEGVELGPWVLAVALERAAALGYVPDEPGPTGGRTQRWVELRAAIRRELAAQDARVLRALTGRAGPERTAALGVLAAALGRTAAFPAIEEKVVVSEARLALVERGAR